MSALQQETTFPDFIAELTDDTTALMNQMDHVYNDTARIRHSLQNKLMKTIDTMEIEPSGNPKVLEAQMRLINEVSSLAGAREKAFTTRVLTRMKKTESESTTKLYGALVVKALSELKQSAGTEFVPSATDDASEASINEIEAKMASLTRIDYNDGETKMDNRDIS